MPIWLNTLREQTPVTRSCIYLQTATRGPLSQSTLQTLRNAEELAAHEGPASTKGRTPLVEAGHATRTGLAKLLNVPAGELCWSLNTSTAMRTVFHALRPKATDHIITSDHEHVATQSLCDGLRDVCGLSINVLPTDGNDDAFLTRLDAAMRNTRSERTIILLSHVSCLDGRRLPVAEACAIARQRSAISLIDGAQAVGQIPVDLQQIGVDFYVASGHKWLLGPAGVGYIHMRADQIATFNPNWLPDADRTHALTAARGETGSINWALRAALGKAIETITTIGVSTIASHTADLAQQLRAGLRQVSNITLLGVDAPKRSTGLIAFQVDGYDAEKCTALVGVLEAEDRIVIKFQPQQTALRVSLAAFNTADEVDALLAALHRRCKE